MTDERLIRLLENPELLTSISFEELKTLALAYPYAHNLRYLLAMKANMENHPDAERLMAAASVFSLDRVQLFKLLHNNLGKQPVAAPAEESPAEQASASPTEASPVEPSATDVLEQQSNGVEAGLNGYALHFSDWYSRFNLPVLQAKVRKKAHTPHQKTFEATLPLFTAQRLAKESITEKPHLYSETMVKLLVKQGLKDKAIAMLNRMRLDNPEKSAYFAAEIEKLKKQ